MAKAKKCIAICNTKNGYELLPEECKSIAEAIRYAKKLGMAYRIFIDGACVKSGWWTPRYFKETQKKFIKGV